MSLPGAVPFQEKRTMEMTDKLLQERIHDLEFRIATLEQAVLMMAGVPRAEAKEAIDTYQKLWASGLYNSKDITQ